MPDDHQSASRPHDDLAGPDASELASVESSDRWRPGRHRRPRPTLVVASVLSSVVAAGVAATGVGWYLLGGGHHDPGVLAASTLRPGGPTDRPVPTRAVRDPLGSTAHTPGSGSGQMLPAPFLPAAQRLGEAGVSLALLGLPVTLPNALPNALPNPVPGAPTPTEIPLVKSPFVLAAGPPAAAGVTDPATVAARTETPGPTRAPGGDDHTGDPTPPGTPTPTGTATPTDEPTPTDTPKPTSTPTKDPTPTHEPTPTRTPTPTSTPTRDPSPTSTPTPTGTPEPTRSPTSDPTPTRKPLPKLPLPLPKSPTIPVPDLP
ncbi:hypothetical protein ABZV93_20025 [Actinopolymorpha sp. NPDC004070]|uniref:hypothetical protein n=1 Tax=Actinopolymorpha sp. NPDC004070 TaxID=3154548 RepID=UPI0033B9EB32